MNEKLLNYFKDDELAAIVWFDKYAAKGEETPDDMHMRMAKAFADKLYERIVETLKNPNPDQDKLLSLFGRTLMDEYKRAFRNNNLEDYLYENIYNLFKEFKYIIPQGSIMSSLGTNTFASLSNCWVVESPYDSYAGIFKTDSELGFYYKRRGGAGTDISNLRPKGTDTNNTAKSTTGAVSFMHRFSNTTREVAQEGRRGE